MFETNSSFIIADYKYCTLKFAGLSFDADNLEFHLHIQYTKLKYIKVTREDLIDLLPKRKTEK